MKITAESLQAGNWLGLNGKTAVITGGAVNIGRAVCLKLASLGVSAAIVYNSSSQAAEKLAEEIRSAGGKASAFQADVSSEKQVEELFEAVMDAPDFGRVDIMVNNSGIFSMSDQVDLPAAEWQKLFNINAMGTFLCSREAAKIMKLQKPAGGSPFRGVIVNIASINAFHPGFGRTVHYDATKGAVNAFSKSLAAELGPSGIRVNAVAPGLVDSYDLRKNAAGLADMVSARNPYADADGSRPLVSAENVADAIAFLASDMASAVTGETLVVDRGYLLS